MLRLTWRRCHPDRIYRSGKALEKLYDEHLQYLQGGQGPSVDYGRLCSGFAGGRWGIGEAIEGPREERLETDHCPHRPVLACWRESMFAQKTSGLVTENAYENDWIRP